MPSGAWRPPSRCRPTRVGPPVSAPRGPRDHVVHQGVLPLDIEAGREVAVAVLIADGGRALWPVEVTAELTHDDGVAQLLEVPEVFFPALPEQGRIDDEVEPGGASGIYVDPHSRRVS